MAKDPGRFAGLALVLLRRQDSCWAGCAPTAKASRQGSARPAIHTSLRHPAGHPPWPYVVAPSEPAPSSPGPPILPVTPKFSTASANQPWKPPSQGRTASVGAIHSVRIPDSRRTILSLPGGLHTRSKAERYWPDKGLSAKSVVSSFTTLDRARATTTFTRSPTPMRMSPASRR